MRLECLVFRFVHRQACRLGSQTTNCIFHYAGDNPTAKPGFIQRRCSHREGTVRCGSPPDQAAGPAQVRAVKPSRYPACPRPARAQGPDRLLGSSSPAAARAVSAHAGAGALRWPWPNETTIHRLCWLVARSALEGLAPEAVPPQPSAQGTPARLHQPVVIGSPAALSRPVPQSQLGC